MDRSVFILGVAALTLSCAVSQYKLIAGYENLICSDSLKIVELRVAHRGSIRKCPDCVLIEYLEGDERNAIFVKPRADCEMSARDVARHSFLPDDANRIVLELTHPARRRLRKCLDSASDPNESVWVLFTVRGQPVAIDLMFGEFSLLFLDAYNAAQLIDALELYEKPETSEL